MLAEKENRFPGKQSLSTLSMRHQDDYTYQAAPQLSYVIQF